MAFAWDGTGALMQWHVPATTAVLYLVACIVHNSRLPRRGVALQTAKTPWLDRAAVLHNMLLVGFSGLVFVVAGYHFIRMVADVGLHAFLCPPTLDDASVQWSVLTWLTGGAFSHHLSDPPPPLSGPLHYWCYVFYISKYYEVRCGRPPPAGWLASVLALMSPDVSLSPFARAPPCLPPSHPPSLLVSSLPPLQLVDTLLLMLRRKRIIFLHAVHHAFIPLVMVLLFDGRVSVSLVGLTCLNSLVHVVMYAYFLLSALHLQPTIGWKRQITRLQIVQFSMGVVGGTYYWLLYFQRPRLVWDPRSQPTGLSALVASLPRLEYVEGCRGGEPRVVLVGYVMNCLLLALFLRFYRDEYWRGRPKVS